MALAAGIASMVACFLAWRGPGATNRSTEVRDSEVTLGSRPEATRREATAETVSIREPSAFVGSHPITVERQSIQYENVLIGALYDGLDQRDPARVRKLVDEYREAYPDDEQALQEGFELIADCMESASDATRASAEAYYERERASTVRRYVRRYCFEANGG